MSMVYRKSLFVLIACYVFMLAVAFLYYPKWQKSGTEATIGWDVSGYYMYLPAIFIYKDIKHCSFKEEVLNKYRPTPDFQQAFKHDSGNYVMKYPCGQAIQFAPFFALAHLYASNSKKWEADGFSAPYQFMIFIESLIVMCIGLWFLRIILLEYFSDGVTALTIVSIALASNYFDYSIITGAMTHNNLFMWYAILIYLTIYFYRKPSFKFALTIGIVVGIMGLTRPTEVMSAVIPIIWGCSVFDMASIRERFEFIKSNYRKYIIAIVACLVIGSIQLIYWKVISGDWIVYSYEEQGFSFLRPHILDGLFSYKSGWLVYSPVMLFSLIGLYYLLKSHVKIISAIGIFTILFIYVTFAWDIWWYGGALGQRAMIQSYPVLAFPMAALISGIIFRNYFKYIFGGILAVCIYFNLWWTHQAHLGGLLKAGQMTKPYFWKVLGSYDHDRNNLKLLDSTDEFMGTVQQSEIIMENEFSTNNCSLDDIVSEGVICLHQDVQYSPIMKNTINSNKQWLRAEADFTIVQKEWEYWRMTQFVIEFRNEGELIKSNMIRVQRLMQPETSQRIYFDTKIPKEAIDEYSVYFWNADSSIPIYIDNLKVSIFNG